MLALEQIGGGLRAVGEGWGVGIGSQLLIAAADLRDQLLRYNTLVVILGTTLLGVSGGLVGTFLVLRKRALAADVVSHSALPGIAIAFLVTERFWPGGGRNAAILLVGALVSGLLGMWCVMAIRRWTRIKDDAALAIVLGLFFGVGMALFTVVQRTRTGNAAGLSHFIFGKAASLVAADVWLIAAVSAVTTLLCVGLFKEFSLLCFDEEFAASQGGRTRVWDWLLTLMAVIVTLIGLQSVGLLLVVALLLIPPAAARFWTNDVRVMARRSALIGGLSCAGGVILSAALPRLAAGAVIVLTGTVVFIFSLLFGRVRGVIPQWHGHRALERRIGRSDLLRACYEYLEPLLAAESPDQLRQIVIPADRLRHMRPWPEARFRPLVALAVQHGLLDATSGGWRLTAKGADESRKAARQHRLWEIYLLTQTDLDPRLVDRGADGIEHVLDAEQLAQLESLLSAEVSAGVPPSPHPIAGAADGACPPHGQGQTPAAKT